MDIYWIDYWIEAKDDKMTLKEQTPGRLDYTKIRYVSMFSEDVFPK